MTHPLVKFADLVEQVVLKGGTALYGSNHLGCQQPPNPRNAGFLLFPSTPTLFHFAFRFAR